MDLNLEPKPENPVQKRNIAMAVSFISAVMIVATLFTHGWLRAPEKVDMGFGLMSLQACYEGACRSESNKAVIAEMNDDEYMPESEKKGPVFWLAGYATLLFGLLAAASLVTAAVTVGQGKLMMKPIAPTSVAMLSLFLALVTACVFVATNPSRGQNPQLGVGWAFWVFGIGNVGGIVAVPMLLKFKPVEQDHF